MSYDLYFYKHKGTYLSEKEIGDYLTTNLNSTSESDRQWFVQNEDTETYFSFDHNEAETDAEAIELFENFTNFDNTHFTFNLNFLRADFFGIEPFRFVDKFAKELDLFILNPQSDKDADNPLKYNTGDLYKNWSEINARNSASFFTEYEMNYLPVDKSSDVYNYNFNRHKLQEKLGEEYFVPKLYFFKRLSDNQIITICTWTEHIPNVFPPADYYLITKKIKNFFKEVTESGLISAKSLFDRFGNQMDHFDFKDCKIIHPDKAEKVKDLFNSTKIEYILKDFADLLPIEKIVNVKPTE